MGDKMEDVAPAISSSLSYGDRSSSPTFPPSFSQPLHSALPPHPPPSHSPTPSATSFAAPSQMTSQQITSLIEDLRHSELSVRLNSFRKMQVIAAALGVQRTRGELIPYLTEFCDDDDEVLLLLTAMLGDMVDAVGGPEHAAVLLPPLEQLAASEEAAVREKAVASLAKITECVGEDVLLEHVLPLLRRCANADWFTSRISATALFHVVYPRLPPGEEIRQELRTLFANLCKKEETPMVKRAAAANLGNFAAVLDNKTLLSDFHSLLVKLSRDEIDSVRLLVVQSCVPVLRVYVRDPATRADNISKLKSIVLSLVDDNSWRVRYMLADKFVELCAIMTNPAAATVMPAASSRSPSPSPSPAPAPAAQTASGAAVSLLKDDDLIGAYFRLFDDAELEVRTSAILKAGEFARLIGSQRTMERFFWIGGNGKPLSEAQIAAMQPQRAVGASRVPPLKAIVADQTQGGLHTKSALASVILQFTPVLSQPAPPAAPGATPPASPNSLIIEHLLPLLLSLLSDEQAEVRLGLIAKLGEESAPGGAAAGSPLTIDVLSSSLLPALSKLSTDTKWRVRLQTIHLLPSLLPLFPRDLFQSKLFDLSLSWLGDSVWSIREAAIQNLVKLSGLLGREWSAGTLLPRVAALASDKSYVFRLTGVFAMRDLAPMVGAAAVTAEMLPLLLHTLAKDPVPNVRFNVARLLGFLVKEGLIGQAGTASGGDGGATPSPLSQTEAVLRSMGEDSDSDVKFCAQQAMKEAFGKN